jgi:hypothetical protein
METETTPDDVVTLWRPTGRAELDLVAASQWRAWPPRLPDQPIFYTAPDQGYATKIAREWNVPAGGEGFVTRFDVRREFLDRYEVRQVGGRDVLEYWIPAGELDELNANIVGAVAEEAHYRGPVDKEEFDRAAQVLGRPLPGPWRAYLQGRSWFHRGWLPSGCYVWLNTPQETLDLQDAWGESTAAHPGIAVIGGDGSREQLVLDLRLDPSPVLMVDITSQGWNSAIPQAEDVAQFIERIETSTFDLVW